MNIYSYVINLLSSIVPARKLEMAHAHGGNSGRDPGNDGGTHAPHAGARLGQEGHEHQGHRHGDHGHDSHDHQGHAHAPTVTHDNERKVLFAFVLIFLFMLVEVAGGLFSGSLALLADAGHMLTDAAALALAYAAFRVGRLAADSARTYGYVRFEVLAGFINAITLFAIVIWIAVEAWQRFWSPEAILAGPMLAVAVAGLLVNILAYRILTRGDSDHVNIRGAALHVLGDLLGSVAAVAAALIIQFTGWLPIDPILSVLVSLLILRSAFALMRESLHILLEGAPKGISPEVISRHLMASVPGLAGVSHIHVWMLSSGRPLATLHVRPTEDAAARSVALRVEEELSARFGIGHATIAIDWNGEAESCCIAAGKTATGDHAHGHGAAGS